MIRRPRCPLCGAQLRRGRAPGQLCGPCEKVGPSPREHLPADFYTRSEVLAWLRAYDFGAFFREVRRLTGWSQQTLGGIVGLNQSHVSALERGDCQLRDITLIAVVADALEIAPVLLNLPDIRATVGAAGSAERRDVSWVDRRDFGQYAAATVLGMAASGLDTDRLLALLPQAEPIGTRRIGIADVEVIEQLTAAFVRQDFAHGSGVIRDAAAGQVRTVLPLLGAQVSSDVRPRLQIATARLAMQAGWMSFEVLDDDAARRLWMIGLDIARATEHPQSTDLTVYLVMNMALQAVHLGRPDEALHLIRVARTAAVGRSPVSPGTMSLLTRVESWAYAIQGDTPGCERALGEAVDHFSSMDPATRPPWGGLLDDTYVAAFSGTAHYYLAVSGRDARAAVRAVPLLVQAVEDTGPGYGRLRAGYLSDLSGAHALSGDVDTAVAVGHQAVDAVADLSSPRAHERLRTLHAVLAPMHPSPGVADLRDRLTTTAA